jgi:hypothetical protein
MSFGEPCLRRGDGGTAGVCLSFVCRQRGDIIMSTIPSSDMPGGSTINTDVSRDAAQITGSGIDSSHSSYGSQYVPGVPPAGNSAAQSSSSARQPDRYAEGSSQTQRSGSLRDKARGHKTGIALGFAVGAIAAAAIPFMLSGRKNSSDRRDVDYSGDVYIERDKYGSARGSGHAAADFGMASQTSSADPGTSFGRTDSTHKL